MEFSRALFRTYRRRAVTRKSGYHVSGIRTGSECIVKESKRFISLSKTPVLKFSVRDLNLENLFEMNNGLIAFSGYIKIDSDASAIIQLEFSDQEGNKYSNSTKTPLSLKRDVWNSIGIHDVKAVDNISQTKISEATITLSLNTSVGASIDLAAVDFDIISYKDYLSNDFYIPFKQKTNIHIPQIYYLSTDYDIEDFISEISELSIEETCGDPIVLKGCNRCSRYLPINITEEETTLAFSNHCKSKAPCRHKSFSEYRIDNLENLTEKTLEYLADYVKNGSFIKSYYGHQLECTACKKFYVNHALNPLRNPQQFKEDGLRRRALEVLVTNLLDKKSIHQEFEYRTKKEFTEYIWEKFNKRCFYCSKKVSLKEMHLDHTMPLAYLYNLDEHATCLCSDHNSRKSDKFPKNFYSEEQLVKLSEITGLELSILKSDSPNMEVVELLVENIVWFFDEFLMHDDYQKVRTERLTADKIYASLEKILKPHDINLLSEYYKKTNGRKPQSITLIVT